MTDSCNVKDAIGAILHFGLVSIRNHARVNPEYAFVEADHLHNLPNYLTAPSDDLLRYYYESERPSYMEAIAKLGGEMESVSRTFYTGPWQVIEEHLKQTFRQLPI